MRKSLVDKLYNGLLIVDSGCWEWQQGKLSKGYGRIRNGYETLSTHRLMWELHNGEIPKGMLICHICDNPPCCNPDHLFLGTYKDNNNDTIIKGRHISGRAILDETKVREIKRLLSLKEHTQQQIADMFSISKPVINHINRGRNWANVV